MMETATTYPRDHHRSFLVVFAVGVLLILRVVYAFHFRFDTDEPQHLHVVWGWATGHTQYREVFDNHGPLFHLCCVPLFWLLGERADLLVLMRLAMLPLLALSLWSIFRLGSTLRSREAGIWAVLLTAFYPEFFLTTTEFRTDDLWTLLWLLVLVVATRKVLGARHAFLAGLLLGMAFCVTVKTGLMIGALVSASVIMILWRRFGTKEGAWNIPWKSFGVGLLGFAVAPGIVIASFVAAGSGRLLLYCNVQHNLIPHTQNWAHYDAHLLWLPIFLGIVIAAVAATKGRVLSIASSQTVWLTLTAGFYFTALKTLFPSLARQDDLPFIPLVVLMFVLLFLHSRRALSSSRAGAWIARGFLPLLLVLEIAGLIVKAPPWKNDTKPEIAMMGDVLRATKPDDCVMDATGETVFRRRPYYYALETFTRTRIDNGLITDDIAECMVETHTAVVRIRDLTALSQAFVRNHYLPTGNGLWMLGKKLNKERKILRQPMVVEIAVGAPYVVLDSFGKAVTGTWDDKVTEGAPWLSAGRHTFVADPAANEAQWLFWALGFARGFTPVHGN